MNMLDLKKIKCIIKGGGDLATGVALSLFKSGFTVIILEIEQPLAVRRTVAFSSAILDGFIEVEGITAKKSELNEILPIIDNNHKLDYIPVIVDPNALSVNKIKPHVLIDAIVCKKNLNTKINDAPLVIALGPGFKAGVDCHIVIETNRGHNLGRIITSGEAEKNTGKPGSIMGYTYERVIRYLGNEPGVFKTNCYIGQKVKKGDIIGTVGKYKLKAKIDGIIRGLLPNNYKVNYYTKIGDIDPRNEISYCYTVSDKSNAIGRAVLEAIMIALNNQRIKF